MRFLILEVLYYEDNSLSDDEQQPQWLLWTTMLEKFYFFLRHQFLWISEVTCSLFLHAWWTLIHQHTDFPEDAVQLQNGYHCWSQSSWHAGLGWSLPSHQGTILMGYVACLPARPCWQMPACCPSWAPLWYNYKWKYNIFLISELFLVNYPSLVYREAWICSQIKMRVALGITKLWYLKWRQSCGRLCR